MSKCWMFVIKASIIESFRLPKVFFSTYIAPKGGLQPTLQDDQTCPVQNQICFISSCDVIFITWQVEENPISNMDYIGKSFETSIVWPI